jgi:ABC transporter substrate binding protein
MRRRAVLALLAGAVTLPPFAARAAGEPTKVFRLGVLSPNPPGPGYRAFVERLHGLGYDEGRNLEIDYRLFNSADPNRTLAMAAELVGRGVDAIYVIGPEVGLKSAVNATSTVPIVMQAQDYDPLAHGYVASLAHPGSNVTGTFFQQIELTPKWLEFLTQTVPGVARVIVLWDRLSADQFEAALEAARLLKIQLDGIECADPPYDYERVLEPIWEDGSETALYRGSGRLFKPRPGP